MKKAVKLTDATYERLSAYGRKSETFDAAILRLFDERDEYRRAFNRVARKAKREA